MVERVARRMEWSAEVSVPRAVALEGLQSNT